ncbi:hypothetical protein E2562_001196 [Oryza meyeriana var. granulata]|uniref:Uncharacterized protein n=1 Tax=Oryza meyeriana var. granulata TaxID=110450 RepID=A0A6G1DBX6_9ORYZ|nr:hypothetical protein E2562_001196 [Oryza meyeriana var. granulata]
MVRGTAADGTATVGAFLHQFCLLAFAICFRAVAVSSLRLLTTTDGQASSVSLELEQAVAGEQAIQLDPDDAALHSNKSFCYLKSGEARDALLDANNCIELRPDWPKGYYRKGAALMSLKEYKEACDAFMDGVKLDPASAEMHEAFWEAAAAFKNEHLAGKTVRGTAADGTATVGAFLHQFCLLAFAICFRAVAVSSLRLLTTTDGQASSVSLELEQAVAGEQAIQLDPDDAALHSNKSFCYLKSGEARDALLDANNCIELRPDWPKGYYRKGAALMSLKEYKEACDAFMDGVKLDPASAEMHEAFWEAAAAFKNEHLAGKTVSSFD